MSDLHRHIEDEIRLAAAAERNGELGLAFSHLERAHVLGQSNTGSHTRVHWLMFRLALKMRSPREIWGQFVRIVGAATILAFVFGTTVLITDASGAESGASHLDKPTPHRSAER